MAVVVRFRRPKQMAYKYDIDSIPELINDLKDSFVGVLAGGKKATIQGLEIPEEGSTRLLVQSGETMLSVRPGEWIVDDPELGLVCMSDIAFHNRYEVFSSSENFNNGYDEGAYGVQQEEPVVVD